MLTRESLIAIIVFAYVVAVTAIGIRDLRRMSSGKSAYGPKSVAAKAATFAAGYIAPVLALVVMMGVFGRWLGKQMDKFDAWLPRKPQTKRRLVS
jgi:hypothetical protein